VPPGLTFKNCTWCSHCVCSVSTFVLYNINRLVLCNRGGECLQRGTHWALI